MLRGKLVHCLMLLGLTLAGFSTARAAQDPDIEFVRFEGLDALPLPGNLTSPLDTIVVALNVRDQDGFLDVQEIGVTLFYDNFLDLVNAPAVEASFVWRRGQGFSRLHPDSSSWVVLPTLSQIDTVTNTLTWSLVRFAIVMGRVARGTQHHDWRARTWVDGGSEPGIRTREQGGLKVSSIFSMTPSKTALIFESNRAGHPNNPLIYPPGELEFSVISNEKYDLLGGGTDLVGVEDSTRRIVLSTGPGAWTLDGLVSGTLGYGASEYRKDIPAVETENGNVHRLALTMDYATALTEQDYVGTFSLGGRNEVGTSQGRLLPMVASVSVAGDSAIDTAMAEVFPHSALAGTDAAFSVWVALSATGRTTGLNSLHIQLAPGYGTPKVDELLAQGIPVAFIDESGPGEIQLSLPTLKPSFRLFEVRFRVSTPVALDPTGTDWQVVVDDVSTPYPPQVVGTGDANGVLDGDNLHVSVVDKDHPPNVTAQIQSGGAEGELLEIAVSAIDPDGDPVQALKGDLSALPPGNAATFTVVPNQSAGLFRWTPGFSASPGPYVVIFSGANALEDTARVELIIANTDRRPVVIAPLTVQGAEGSPLPAPVIASDPDGDPILSLVADFDSLPPGHSATFIAAPDGRSGQVQWTPGFTHAGSWPVRYYASNALTGTARTVLDVSNTDRPPTTDAPATVTASTLAPVDLVITGTDPDGEPVDSLTADLSALPGSPSFTRLAPNQYRLQWTPALLLTGSFDVYFSAHNALTGQSHLRIDVGLLDRAPLVTVARNATVAAGDTLTLSVSALDPDGDAILLLSADLTRFPPGHGATFQTNGSNTLGTLRWVPRAGDAPGEYDAIFTASNLASDSALSTIKVTPEQRGLEIGGVALAANGVRRPGGATGEVLGFSLVNRTTVTHTLQSLRFENRTTGPGTLDQRDADWTPLTLVLKRARAGVTGIPAVPAATPVTVNYAGSFAGGEVTFDSLAMTLDSGDSLTLSLRGGASLIARDGDVLDVEILSASDLVFAGTPKITGSFPINPIGGYFVDGMTRDQITLFEVPAASFQVGSRRNTALAFRIPPNGYETDVLRRINVQQLGTAEPDSDLTAMEAWVDDGNHAYGAGDAWLGALRFTGDRWELTGLSTTIPMAGLPVIVTVDIADVGTAGRTVRLGLPGPPDVAIGVASGNSGPVDAPLDNTASQTITVKNRVTIAGMAIAPQTVNPGQRDIPFFTLTATNTYDFNRRVTGLVLTNVTTGPGAISDLDGEFQSLVVREDGNDNGLLDGPAVDPVLASSIFVAGRASFSGFAWNLPGGASRQLFVTAELSLMGAADGDRIEAQLERALDVSFDSVTTVAALWPVRPGASHTVDGLLASQIVNNGAPGVTLGPGDGPVCAFDVTIPRNGYADDVLQGFTVVNAGTADTSDIAELRLWRDGGDGNFDMGAGDDRDLGPLTWFNGAWQSALLAEPLASGGARLHVGLTVTATPGDSVLVLLQIPAGGVTAQSGNSGPLDQPVQNAEPHLISTAPLLVSIQITPPASTPGIPVTVRMNVHNASAEQITGITPSSPVATGSGSLTSLTGPAPGTFDLDPGADSVFVWTAAAATPGDVRLAALAGGTSSGLPRRSLMTVSNLHQIFSRTDSLDLFAIQSMPATVNRGQDDVLPLTLTLSNPGPSGSSDVRLLGLRLRVEDGTGAGIVPSFALDRVEVREGATVYAVKTAIETTGSDVDLTFAPPVLVRTLDPVTLGLRIGISATASVPAFRLAIPDGSAFTAEDATSGLPVTVGSNAPVFPVLTAVANVITSASEIRVSANLGGPKAVARGQSSVPYLDLSLLSPSPDSSASDVRVSSVAVKLLDSTGVTVADPGLYLAGLEAAGPFGTLATVSVAPGADSLITLDFSPLLSVPVNTTVGLELSGQVTANAPLGVHRLALGPAAAFVVRDAGTGDPVPANYLVDPVAGDSIRVELAATEMRVAGEPLAPPVVGLGRPDVPLLAIAIRHPGTPETGRIRLGTMFVNVLDESRRPLSPATFVDRLSVLWNGVPFSTPPIPSSGAFSVALDSLALSAGEEDTLLLAFDVEASAPVGFIQFEVGASDFVSTDENTGGPIAILPDTGATLPMTSGVFRIEPPARTLSVAFASMMPPALAAGAAVPVARATLTNVAPVGTGTVVVDHLTLRASDRNGAPLLTGTMCERVEVWQGATRWGDSGVIDPAADTIRVSCASPLDIAPGVPADLELRLTPRGGPLADGFRLGWQASGIGVVQPSSTLLEVAVLPVAGQNFPMWTAPGNLTPTTLEASYSNFPNPFAAGRENTAFVYYLPSPGRVSLRIFTARGDPVATVLDGVSSGSGLHQSLLWDGRNGRGTVVTNGVYVAELKVAFDGGGEQRLLRKLAVVR